MSLPEDWVDSDAPLLEHHTEKTLVPARGKTSADYIEPREVNDVDAALLMLRGRTRGSVNVAEPRFTKLVSGGDWAPAFLAAAAAAPAGGTVQLPGWLPTKSPIVIAKPIRIVGTGEKSSGFLADPGFTVLTIAGAPIDGVALADFGISVPNANASSEALHLGNGIDWVSNLRVSNLRLLGNQITRVGAGVRLQFALTGYLLGVQSDFWGRNLWFDSAPGKKSNAIEVIGGRYATGQVGVYGDADGISLVRNAIEGNTICGVDVLGGHWATRANHFESHDVPQVRFTAGGTWKGDSNEFYDGAQTNYYIAASAANVLVKADSEAIIGGTTNLSATSTIIREDDKVDSPNTGRVVVRRHDRLITHSDIAMALDLGAGGQISGCGGITMTGGHIAMQDGDVTGARRVVAQVVTATGAQLAYGATVTPNAAAAEFHRLVVTNANPFTIANPTNVIQNGQRLIISIENDIGGTMGTVTWGSAYKLAGAWVSPATGFRRSITFRYNGWLQTWEEDCRTAADAPRT